MNDLWIKIKVWTKTAILALLVIYALCFIFENLSNQATFWWWFNHEYTSSVLVLALVAFLCGAIIALLIRTMINTFKQMRELIQRNRQAKLHSDVAEMKAKADKLQTRDGPAMPPTPQ
jgi:hypothetical protein